MSEPRNRVVQVRRFGSPDELEVVNVPMPSAGRRAHIEFDALSRYERSAIHFRCCEVQFNQRPIIIYSTQEKAT
jgi:hypothetical protein